MGRLPSVVLMEASHPNSLLGNNTHTMPLVLQEMFKTGGTFVLKKKESPLPDACILLSCEDLVLDIFTLNH